MHAYLIHTYKMSGPWQCECCWEEQHESDWRFSLTVIGRLYDDLTICESCYNYFYEIDVRHINNQASSNDEQVDLGESAQ